MRRRRKTDFWADPLPMEMEWILGLVFLIVWIGASLGYYWAILGRIDHLVATFAPFGIKPDDSAFLPLLEMGIRLAPFVGLPVAYRAWRWTRQMILRSFSGAF